MLKKTIITCLAVLSIHLANGQSITNNSKYYQSIGVQANPILQEILNFGGQTANSNPFLLKYQVISNRTGQGLNLGLGVSIFDSKDKENRQSESFNLVSRLGYIKYLELGNQFEVGLGMDVVYANDKNLSKNINTNVFGNQTDSTFSTVNSSTESIGFGPQMVLNFQLTKNLFIGTEATFYGIWNTNKSHFENRTKSTNNGQTIETTDNDNTEENSFSFDFQTPITLFLSIKF